MAVEIEHYGKFTAEMFAKLASNQHKKGSPRGQLSALAMVDLLKIEVMELEVAFRHLGPEDVCEELVDIANFCLLIHKRVSPNIGKKDSYLD